jgi:hypothetical protein
MKIDPKQLDVLSVSIDDLCSVLDGASRALVAWDIRPQMREADDEIIIQRAREAYPGVRPRIIIDSVDCLPCLSFAAWRRSRPPAFARLTTSKRPRKAR